MPRDESQDVWVVTDAESGAPILESPACVALDERTLTDDVTEEGETATRYVPFAQYEALANVANELFRSHLCDSYGRASKRTEELFAKMGAMMP